MERSVITSKMDTSNCDEWCAGFVLNEGDDSVFYKHKFSPPTLHPGLRFLTESDGLFLIRKH